MCNNTPTPPMDSADEFGDLPLDDDIEIIEDVEIEEEFGGVYGAEAAPVHDDAKVIFSGHTGAVFCCGLDSSLHYAVSGGEDDKGFVWNLNNGEIVLECSGHKDSVISAGFNYDCTLVATADMSGFIQVWNIESKARVWNFETADLRWLEWHHGTNVLLAGTADGDGWMWRIPDGDTKSFQSYGTGSSYGRIMPDGCRAVMGYDDGSIRFWDLKKKSVIYAVTDARSHSSAVTTVDCYQDNTLVITGSTDCTSKLINSNTGRVLNTFQCGNEISSGSESSDAVESVAFFYSHPLIATGTLHGSLAVWDIATHMQRLQCKQESAIVKLVCDRVAPLVFTAGLDGVVRLWDGRSGQQEGEWKGHTAEILDIFLSKDGDTILTASEDNTCRVFTVGNHS